MRKIFTENVGAIGSICKFNNISIEVKSKDQVFHGVLKQASDGYVYLDVSNDFINNTFPLINEVNIEKPPYFDGKYKRIGAHISVINSDEAEFIEGIEELGEVFSFTLGQLESVEPESWEEMSMVWFLEVDSKELTHFRRKYGLSPRLNGHKFHITVACKRRN